MKPWDLTTGTARLASAWEALQKAQAAVTAQWNDLSHEHFQDNYYRPLEPKVRRALDAVRRLDEILRKAERECGTE
jgi:uncharacterized protein YukE